MKGNQNDYFYCNYSSYFSAFDTFKITDAQNRKVYGLQCHWSSNGYCFFTYFTNLGPDCCLFVMKILRASRKSRIDVFLVKFTIIISFILSVLIAYMVGSYHGHMEGSTAALRMIYLQVNSGEKMKEAIETTKEGLHAGNIEFRKSR